MKTLVSVIICAIAVGVGWYFIQKPSHTTSPQPKSHIEINKQAFANMRSKTKWNLEGDLLWGFFFTNPTKEPLEPVAKLLQDKGYRFVDIHLDDEKKNWWLHVERVEIHTAESLTQREAELSAIAAKANLGSYDGWDVGPAPR